LNLLSPNPGEQSEIVLPLLGIEILAGGRTPNHWLNLNELAGAPPGSTQRPAFRSQLWEEDMASEKWDAALRGGRRLKGLGNDDAELMLHIGAFCNVAYVKGSPPTWHGAVEAIKSGRFYVRSRNPLLGPPRNKWWEDGPCISNIGVDRDGRHIFIDTRGVTECYAYDGATFFDVPNVNGTGHIGLKYVFDVANVGAGAKYVRFECRTEDKFENLWTQPFYLRS
jgi:hypothetical protein